MTSWDTSPGTSVTQDQNPPWPATSPWPPQPVPGGPGGTPSGPPPFAPKAVWQQPGGIAAADFGGSLPLGPTAPPGTNTNQLATTAFVTAAITESTTGVASWNTRTGAVVMTLADVEGVGGAPAASPALTGNPTAPTAAPGTSTTQLATTQFVQQALSNWPGVTSFNGRGGVVTLTLSDVTSIGGAPLASPNLSGTPITPTAAIGTNTAQVASTAFVMNAIGNSVVSWNGRVGAVTMTLSDITTAGGAPLASPTFTGTPAVPTASPGTATTQAASTAFVMNAVTAATAGVSSFNTRTGAITLTAADVSAAGGALLAGPSFTGAPTAPTPAAGNDSNQLATTAFVQTALSSAGVVASFNGRTGAVTLSAGDVATAGALMESGGTMTGVLTLAGNAATALAAVPYQQLTATVANYLPLTGGTITGPLTLPGNATGVLQAVPLQQLTASLANYLPLAGGTLTGALNLPAGTSAAPSLNFAAGGGLYGVNSPSGIESSGAFTVGTNLGVNGTLTVIGNTGLSGTLNVSGVTTLAGVNAGAVTATSLSVTPGNTNLQNTSVSALTITGTQGITFAGITGAAAWQFWFNGTYVVARANGTTDYPLANASDERMKEEIEATKFDGLAAILDVPLWQFKWKATGEYKPIGFVAQRTESAFPSAITGLTGHKDGTSMMLGMDQNTLLAAAFDAIKRLHGTLQQLDARLLRLEEALL